MSVPSSLHRPDTAPSGPRRRSRAGEDYATSLAFFGHAVGETDDDLKALIGSAPSFDGPGILVPVRSPLFRWCLDNNLGTVQLMTLMSRGLYNEPAGAFLPSILF